MRRPSIGPQLLVIRERLTSTSSAAMAKQEKASNGKAMPAWAVVLVGALWTLTPRGRS